MPDVRGDPGESRFYLSLEDDLMRLFGSDKLMSMFNALGVPENEQIEHKMLSTAIEKAQKKIETNNYGIRENLLKYDEVMNEQREVIYAERLQVLNGENMRNVIMKMLNDIVEGAVDMSIGDEQSADKWNFKELNELILPIIPLKPLELNDEIRHMKKDELKHALKEKATKFYEAKEAEFPDAEQIREIERVVLLKVIDNKWMSEGQAVSAEKQQEAEEKLSGIRGEVKEIGWGNQIRSYVLQPYTMVKDHRTNEETGNVDAVLDGGIDIFINAYLKWIALAKKERITLLSRNPIETEKKDPQAKKRLWSFFLL